jgi:hypothetical protein
MVDIKLVKSAGEHWACGVLAGLGWAAALTRDGLERTDILVVHTESRAMIEVQIKTASYMPRPNWRLNAKAQHSAVSEHEWFVLIALGPEPWHAHRAFVIPRNHVAAAAWIRHHDWLTDQSAPAGQRNAPVDQARCQDWVFKGYEQRWDLLAIPTSEVPVLLPSRVHELARTERVGLPADHPWRVALPLW